MVKKKCRMRNKKALRPSNKIKKWKTFQWLKIIHTEILNLTSHNKNPNIETMRYNIFICPI